MTNDRNLEARLLLNRDSQVHAHSSFEEWSPEDEEFLREFWCETDPKVRNELEIARALGRSLLACQVKASQVRNNRTTSHYCKTTRTITTTTVTEVYRGWMEGMGDE